MQRSIMAMSMALVIATTASCAGNISRSDLVKWEKPGVSPEQSRAEYGLCGGGFDSVGQPKFHPTEFDGINRCMTRKGFKLVTL